MAEYDGSIRINTQINTDGIVRGMQEVRQAIVNGMSNSEKPMQNAKQEVKQLGDSFSDTAKKASEMRNKINEPVNMQSTNSQLMSLENRIAKTSDKIAASKAKMEAAMNAQTPTQEYAALDKELGRLTAEYDKIAEKQSKFLQTGGKENSSTFKRMEYDLNSLDAKQDEVITKMKALEESGKAFIPSTETEEFKKAQAEVINYTNDMNALVQKYQELSGAIEKAADAERVRQSEINIDRALARADKESETPPELLQPKYERPEIESWQRGASTEEGKRMAQELADAMARIGESAQDSASKSNEAIASMTQELSELKARQKELEKSGMGLGFEEYDTNVQRIAEINNALSEYRSELLDTGSSYVSLKEAAQNAFKIMAKGLKDIPIAAVKAGINGIISSLKKMGNIVQKSAIAPFKLLEFTAKKAFSSIGKSSKSSNNMFQKGFKSILKYGLGIRSTYALINKFRTAVKEGFSNLYNDSNMTAFKKQVDSLKASLLTLKNSFAAAFRPIVEVAIPYIQKLIDYMISMLNVIGQFMAAITGQKNYTKSIKQTTAAINDQNKAQNKQLSGLDKLNNLTSGSGGGGASSTEGMFEEAPVDERWQNIAQWLKDMWSESDFTELGSFLGERLKESLDNIPWDSIQEKARNLGKSLATLINGAIETDGLGYSIGNTLAQGINTAFNFLNEAVHTLHWDSIGTFISETLNGIFENIDWNLIYDTFVTGAKGLGDAVNSFTDNLNWGAIATTISNFVNTFMDTMYTLITTIDWLSLGEKVGKSLSDAWIGIDWAKAGETLGEYFKAFFDFIGKAIENVDWWAVGESVKDFLIGIDWAGVADSFFEAVGAAFGGLFAFLSGLFGEAIASLSDWWNTVAFDENGNFTMEGLLNGISESLKNIGNWIKEHIFQPFINGFKKAFGIHSPSTVMAEMGTYTIQGLLNGITSLVDKVKETWESMKETALEVWENVKTGLSEKWESIKEAATTKWSEIKENLHTTWDNMKTTAETSFSAIKDYVQDKWQETEDSTGGTWGRIKETVSSITSDVKEVVGSKFSEILGSFGGFSSDAESVWGKTWESIKNKLGSILGSIKDAISSAFDWVSDKIGSIGSAISGAFSGGKSAPTSYSAVSPYSAMPQMVALSNMDFPGYATGQVIPTSMKKHLAWLGDNNHETEVVSPLSTIEQAVENAMLRVNGTGNGKIVIEIPIYLDKREIGRGMQEYDREVFMRRGRGAFEH